VITYRSQLTPVFYAGCVGAHFGLYQFTTYTDKKQKEIRDKRHGAASDYTKKKKSQCSSYEKSHKGGLAGKSYFQEGTCALARNKISAIQTHVQTDKIWHVACNACVIMFI